MPLGSSPTIRTVKGTLLATVLESDARQFAESLLKRVMAISPASQLRLTTKGADDTEETGWSLTIEEERKRSLAGGILYLIIKSFTQYEKTFFTIT
jgi:hypothetical protein